MIGYYVTSAICLFLLFMIPIWSPRTENQVFPIWVILLLAVVVFLVPIMIRRRKREGAAMPGEIPVHLEEGRRE